jgi:murein DD-endopeptidase MepM/ murein hydrolase activator NlpD
VLRLFPRNDRRRWIAALAVSGVLLSAVALPLAHAEDLKDKKHKIEKDIKEQKEEIEHASKRLQEAQAALAQSQAELTMARAYLAKTEAELQAAIILDQQMQAKLDAAIARLEQARKDLETGLAKVEEQNLLLRRIVVAHYQSGDPSLVGLSSVLTSQDPAEINGQIKSAEAVMDKESVILDRLEATKVMLTVKQREVNAAKIDVEIQRKAAAENLLRKQALEAAAEQAEEQVAQMVTMRSRAAELAKRAKKADLKELAKLKAEEQRIQDLILAQTSKGSGYTGPVTGNGWLDWPTPGNVTSGFGYRIHPIYGYRSLHDGIDIASPCGTAIRASQSGTVLSEYYQSAWGNRLIMDHGVKYGVGVASIYNHLSGYAVATGEHVKKGQIIGYVGTTGWSTGCHLHFTVMENAIAVDPLKWL